MIKRPCAHVYLVNIFVCDGIDYKNILLSMNLCLLFMEIANITVHCPTSIHCDAGVEAQYSTILA